MQGRLFILAFVWAVATLPPAAVAQETEQDADSLIAYDLAEIVVDDGRIFETSPSTLQRVTIAQIARENAVAVADLARVLPAAHIQTNSRGESLIYIRNAGERQVAVFFNGALLNVPWDNRVNLDLIPAGVIGGMSVAKGVPSVLYGTNVLGGAVNLTSRSLDTDGKITEASIMAGSEGHQNYQVTHLWTKGPLSITAAGGWNARNALPLASDAILPFSQQTTDSRTNTDRQFFNGYAHGQYDFKTGVQLGLSLLQVGGKFGVAPEGHIDPTGGSVRYWRYPDWTTSMAIVNTMIPIGTKTIIRGAAWSNRFGQTINQFESEAYQSLIESQTDVDLTFGARISLIHDMPLGQLSVGLNGLASQHEEDIVAGAEPPDNQVYAQRIYSVGAEYQAALASNAWLTLGASFDGITTPKTGDKPALEPFRQLALTSGLQVQLSDSWNARASLGRKVRFPTLRELFGVALNRFLLNPDLKPETSLAAELALARAGRQFSGEFVAFLNRTFDTIDQRRVDGPDGVRLRQRINLEGSRVWGFEVAGTSRPWRGGAIDGHLTWMKPRGLEGGNEVFLTEKPAVLGTLTLSQLWQNGLSFLLQGTQTGRAYGLEEDNTLSPLPTSLVLDARLSYMRALDPNNRFVGSIFVRANNFTDAVTFPQLGLPGPGRYYMVGLELSF